MATADLVRSEAGGDERKRRPGRLNVVVLSNAGLGAIMIASRNRGPGISRRDLVKGTGLVMLHGVLPQASHSGASAQDDVGGVIKKLRITLENEQLRILDSRLPGGISGAIRDGEHKYSLLAGCELGVWRFDGDAGRASESTADLIFADNLARQKYAIKGVTVRTDTVVNGDLAWSEPKYAETVEDIEIKKLIPFGCRAIKRLDKIFYLTSLGLFVFDEQGQKWRTCSALIPELLDSPTIVQPNSGIYDISLVRVFDGRSIYLVAAQSGLYLMTLNDDFATTFTEVKELRDIPAIFVGSQASAESQTHICFTRSIPYSITVDAANLTYRIHRIDNEKPEASPFKFADAIGQLNHVVELANGDFLLLGSVGTAVTSVSATYQENMPTYDLVAKSIRLENDVDAQEHLDVMVAGPGQKAVLVSHAEIGSSRIIIANGKNLLVWNTELETVAIIDLDIGQPPYDDQFLTSVSMPWDDSICVGTSAGGVAVLPVQTLLQWIEGADKIQTIDPKAFWSREAPMLIGREIVSGPIIVVKPGEYIVNDANPPCSGDVAEAQKEAIIYGFLAIASAFGAQNPVVAESGLAALWECMRQIMIVSGVHDQLEAQLAKTFFGYDGHANCAVIPSMAILEEHKLISVYPRVIEGAFSGDPKMAQFGDANFGVDAPCGWARFDGQDNNEFTVTLDEKPLKMRFVTVKFKNWSHNRDRSAKLDILIERNQAPGRKTVIVN